MVSGSGGTAEGDPEWLQVPNHTAAEKACPNPPLVSYVNVGRSAEFDALCEGGTQFNGFYGFGIVDAYAGVTAHAWWEHH